MPQIKLIDDNHLRPVIESVFELADAAKGYRAIEDKHTKGKVILRVIREQKKSPSKSFKIT